MHESPLSAFKISRIFSSQWSKTRIGRIVYPNLAQLERFLPEDSMLALLICIESASKSDIEKRYRDECYLHIARGGDITISPEIVGKVVEREQFATWLLLEYRHIFAHKLQVEKFIDGLIMDAPRDDDEDKILMGNKYLIWVTWNENNPSGNPFDFIKFDMAEEARACLGLEPKNGQRLLLLTYKGTALNLIKPTIADAGLFTFFQLPPPDEERHGWTRPWEPAFLSDTLKAIDPRYSPQPKPEAVHMAGEAPLKILLNVRELV